MTIPEFYNTYFKPGRISTDSRKISTGSVFIALRGDNFNGNQFAGQALQSGASIAVVDEKIEGFGNQILQVSNTLIFLHKLAHFHRVKNKLKIIGLTGSNGKTTTKELLHTVLSEKFKVQSTQGNLNNHIGVPLTLLSVEPDTEYSVIEMGANHPGEIKTLCTIADPDSGLITNIGRAHLEGFGSFEGVIKTKSELFDYLAERNRKFYCNGSDELLNKIVSTYKNCIFYNSTDSTCYGKILASASAISVEITDKYKNSVIVDTQLFGDYNLINILAAACIALDNGMTLEEIKSGIEKYQPSNFRSQVFQIGFSTIIMDCYNANPSSMELALKNVANSNAERKIVILGGMKELGNYSETEHEKLFKLAENLKFDEILLFGKEFKEFSPAKGITTESFDELTRYIHSMNLNNSLILIKGSRINQLERLQSVLESYYSSKS